MPVQKFRSIDEMNTAPIRVAGEPAFERFTRHCRRYWLISQPTYPRGVFKFRTLEEAQAARVRESAKLKDASRPRRGGGGG